VDYFLYRHIAADPETIAMEAEEKKHIVAPTFLEAAEEVFYTGGGYNPWAF
jgi:hypothetical protein